MKPPGTRAPLPLFLAALLALATGARGADAPPSLTVAVRARAIAPGEPLHVIAHGPADLTRLSGSFLGRTLQFERRDGASGGGRSAWEGWTLVPLDAAPGPATIELLGEERSGRIVRGVLAVEVADKEFPVERLRVARRFVEPAPEVARRLARERARLAKIYRRRTPGLRPSGPFRRPVPGRPTSIFGTRRLFNGQPRDPHPGLDLEAAPGTPVHASGDGVVVLAAELYYSGNTVIVDHGEGLFTIYAHLSRIAVREGDRVRAGEVVGASGATGRVTGPHLHWGAKIGDEPFDPRALLDPVLFRD